jgi:hypothetical protein
MFAVFIRSKQGNVVLLTNSDRLFIPNAGLNLSNVGTSHHQHAKAGLSYSSSDSEGKLVV